jgi:hypothetical protein
MEVRDRIAAHAKNAGEPTAAFLSPLLDVHGRTARFDAVRVAQASADDSYRAETRVWDGVRGEGIDDA